MHGVDTDGRGGGHPRHAHQRRLARTSGTLIPFHVTQLVVLSNRVTHFDPVQNDALRWHLVSVVD